MTIDEKIKQAAEAIADAITIDGRPLVNTERSSFIFGFYQGEQYPKSEMLADMQKLVEALEFYADMAKDDNESLDDCLERACIDRAESKEYNLSGKYVAEKAVKALAEFSAKYKGEK